MYSNSNKKLNSCFSNRSEASRSKKSNEKKSSQNIEKKSNTTKNCKKTPITKKHSFCNKSFKDINNKTKKKSSSNLNIKKEPIEKVKLETNSNKYIDASIKEKTVSGCNSDPIIDNKNSCELIFYFFANLESILKNFKSAQESEKAEILINLTKLENKINLNECKIETLTFNMEKIFSIFSDVDTHIEMENNECFKKHHTNNIEDIYFMDKQNRCDLDNCVCKLIGNKTTSNKISISNKNSKRIINDNITLCELLKLKPDLKDTSYWKNPFEIEIIPDNEIKISKQVHEEKISTNLPICIKKPKNIVKDDIKGIQLEKKIKPSSKNKICDFLLSHPTPEWINNSIKQVEKMKTSEDQCEKISKPQEKLSCSTFKCRKLYNVERIIKNNRCKKEIVYQISLNSDNQKTKDKANKLEDLVPNYTKICTS